MQQTEKEAIAGKNETRKGLNAVFSIFEKWEFKNEEMRILLGQPSRQTFYNWKNGKVGNIPHDTTTRLSYILGIYKALQILFPNPDRADSWINKPNSAFGNQSAKERMLAGEITDLARIRHHLDSARGAW